MKKSRFTEEQIVFVLKQAELGTSVPAVCRKLGISDATSSCQDRHVGLISDYAAQTILLPLMQFLRKEAPGFDLVISQAGHDMMLAQLSEGGTDLAMGILPGEQMGVNKSELFPEQFICLADRQFLPENRELTLEE
ncbi:TPA: transposase [Klebsiella aerogenes]|nr:transposase [Klebsiella aerogenes]